MATHGRLHWVGAAVLGFCCGGPVSGCNLEKGFADFGDDLVNPEMVRIDGPGTKVADGQLSSMLVDPWGNRGAMVLGFRSTEQGPTLRLQPLDGGKGCGVGPAQTLVMFEHPENEPQLIAFLDEFDGHRGTLYFANHQCEVVYGGIKEAALPDRLFDAPPGMLVPAGTDLLDIDPYRKTTRIVAQNVTIWPNTGDADTTTPIWFVADGQLVVLNDARQQVLRLGSSVTEVRFEANDPTKGLYLVDGGTLTWYERATGVEPTTLATDVCRTSLVANGISYLSPCIDGTPSADARLFIQDPELGTRFELDSGITRLYHAQSRTVPGGTEVAMEAVYAKPSVTAPEGDDLWLKLAKQAPQLWKQHIGQLIAVSTAPSPTLVAVVEFDGTRGRLIRVDSDAERTICDDVYLSRPVEATEQGWLLLTDVVDGVGTLTLVNEAGAKTTVIEHYDAVAPVVASPRRAQEMTGIHDERYYNLQAHLTDIASIDDSRVKYGTITLFNGSTLDGSLKLGTTVPSNRFGFFRNMSAISYLDNYDQLTKTGTLTVYQTRIGVTSVVSENVTDFSEVLWPWQGVIYSVKNGEKYSVWAARAKP